MLFITGIGNLTNDPVLKTDPYYGDTYTILRVASDRNYRDHNGGFPTDFISVKFKNKRAEYCLKRARKGCLVAFAGNFETIVFDKDPLRQPGYLVKGKDVWFFPPGTSAEAVQQSVAASADDTGAAETVTPVEAGLPDIPDADSGGNDDGAGSFDEQAENDRIVTEFLNELDAMQGHGAAGDVSVEAAPADAG